ncbi:MAG: GapR family DNA-binding domain-containing protein [bacterium]
MTEQVGNNSGAQIRSIIERIETIEAEIKARQEDRTSIYDEAKGNGLAPKILRKIVSLRKKSRDALAEEQELLRLYVEAAQLELGI